jgi:hypothetical protein
VILLYSFHSGIIIVVLTGPQHIIHYGGVKHMAQSDLDSMPADTRTYKTATEQLEGFGESVNDTENRAAAQAAGVLDAAYIDYDEALDAYAARDDIEDLQHKNARDIPADFAEASFMREVDGNTVSSSGH